MDIYVCIYIYKWCGVVSHYDVSLCTCYLLSKFPFFFLPLLSFLAIDRCYAYCTHTTYLTRPKIWEEIMRNPAYIALFQRT